MKKKSILTMVVSLMLVGAVAVGSTLAYLTSQKSQKNVITVGNVNITQEEEEWELDDDGSYRPADGTVLIPGITLPKAPIVTVTGGSEDCYVYMKVDIPWQLEELLDKDVSNNPEDGKIVTINDLPLDGRPSHGWVQCSYLIDGGIASYIYKYEKVVTKSDKDTALEALFTGITINPKATQEQIASLTDSFDITVSSFAIQANGLGTDANRDDLRLAQVGW
jgi:predicted ribosomally synthesized peptide with SipW-like signal peptide